MFWRKKSFDNKSIEKVKIKKKGNFYFLKNYIKWFIVLWLIFSIIFFWTNISNTLGNYTKKTVWLFVKNISWIMWKKAKTDNLWNINILLMWVWWKWHDWSWLTDTMMIASFNPRLWTLTFLSIPRDLYVKYNKYSGGRINAIFADEYIKSHNFWEAAHKLEKKIKQIIGIQTNYYVLVDFWWFEKLVNSLWWVTVNVKENLVDHRYPGPNRTYTTFSISKWIHHLDGITALKYARSRHSTSDFSRSARQEQIIRAILDKLTSSWILLSPSKIKNLYLQFENTVHTDFDFNTLLWFVKYAKNIKIHSYVLNWDCFYKTTYWKNLTPWCFVYPATRSDFNWQAVLLPVWATPKNIENYKDIRKFAFIVLSYPELWLEKDKIQILNGIWNNFIRKYYKWYLKPVASNLAYKLKNYWFNIVDIKNSNILYKNNVWYIYHKKPITQWILNTFVWDINYKTWDIKYSGSGYDMTLILWKDYLLNQ